MRFREAVVWWLAAVLSVLAGIGAALAWFRPDHVTLPAPDEAAPRTTPQPAPPALAHWTTGRVQAAGRKPSIDR
jgi:hypothetical protein